MSAFLLPNFILSGFSSSVVWYNLCVSFSCWTFCYFLRCGAWATLGLDSPYIWQYQAMIGEATRVTSFISKQTRSIAPPAIIHVLMDNIASAWWYVYWMMVQDIDGFISKLFHVQKYDLVCPKQARKSNARGARGWEEKWYLTLERVFRLNINSRFSIARLTFAGNCVIS